MEKAVAAVLMLFIVLPMIAADTRTRADKPLVMPKTRIMPMESITGDGAVATCNCPGGGSCNGGTCCMHISGGYGCCSLQGANCCDDYVSCCHSGYVCDAINNLCLKAGISEDVLEKLPFLKIRK